jgi:hypothetical protein
MQVVKHAVRSRSVLIQVVNLALTRSSPFFVSSVAFGRDSNWSYPQADREKLFI